MHYKCRHLLAHAYRRFCPVFCSLVFFEGRLIYTQRAILDEESPSMRTRAAIGDPSPVYLQIGVVLCTQDSSSVAMVRVREVNS